MRFVYNFHADHPRLLWRDSDLTTLQNRSNDTTGWKTDYDGKILAVASELYSSYAVSAIATDTSIGQLKVLALLLCGEIENNDNYRQKALDVAVYVAGVWSSYTGKRPQSYILAWVYDILYDWMPSATRSTLRSAMKSLAADWLTRIDNNAKITSHSGHNALVALCLGAAIATEDAAGLTYIDAALNHWYGENAGDAGRIDYDRYFLKDGGSARGTEYHFSEQHPALWWLHTMHMSFRRNVDVADSLTLDGVPYEPWSSEAEWVEAAPEWWIYAGIDGLKDYGVLGDSDRLTDPWVNDQEHAAFGQWIAHGSTTWRKILRWIYDQKCAKATVWGIYYCLPFIAFDKADADKQPVHPKDASPSLELSRWFDPPQHYALVHPSFEYTTATRVHMPCWSHYIDNHMHLDAGAIYIDIAGDHLLFNTGLYETSDTAVEGSLYAGGHHRKWYQQSIACPGVPLVEGPSGDGSREHYNYVWNGSGYPSGTIPNALGGQCYVAVGGLGGDYAPDDIFEMLQDGGGYQWLKCTAGATRTDDCDFVHADIRRAYLKEYTDLDGSSERVRLAHVRSLVLKSIWARPIIFRVVRLQSRLASMKKRDHFNGHTAPSWDIAGRRYYLRGAKGIGKVYVDYHNASQLTFTTVGGGSVDSNGYGADDFKYDGVNHPPQKAASTRKAPFVGHYRVEASPASSQVEDYFVCLILPMLVGELPPAYSFFEEPNWFGVDFSGTQVRIHKTLDQYQYGEVDTEPPGVVQDVAAEVGSGSGKILVTWSPNPEVDGVDAYYVLYKEKD